MVGSAGSLGAFEGAPKEATNTIGLKLGGGNSRQKEPVDIPKDVHWAPPVTIQQAAFKGGERAVVTYVGDGDGAILKRKDGSSVECRIDTIDAPEVAHPAYGKPGQTFGEEAKRTLASMIENKEVTLRITRPAVVGATDKSRRSYCQIEIEGKGVDAEMIRKGAAWLYRRYANDPELARLEQQARANKIGLWADPNPENPEAFRRRIERQR